MKHDPIITKCEGWWGDFDCPDATHVEHKSEEDPTEEGKYDNHKR